MAKEEFRALVTEWQGGLQKASQNSSFQQRKQIFSHKRTPDTSLNCQLFFSPSFFGEVVSVWIVARRSISLVFLLLLVSTEWPKLSWQTSQKPASHAETRRLFHPKLMKSIFQIQHKQLEPKQWQLVRLTGVWWLLSKNWFACNSGLKKPYRISLPSLLCSHL